MSYIIAKNVMIPMRDGVRLAADIYRPAVDGEPAPGRFPTILGRTSYDKETPWMWVKPVAEFFVQHGYVVVVQDLRGRHHSEGTGQYYHASNVKEGEDGYDTVEWIARQPWSNGRVGVTGSSHGAIVQTALALERPPHLSALWPDVGPTNYYANMSREGGAMQLHMFGALFLHAHDAQETRNDPEGKRTIFDGMERLREWVFRTPFKPGETPLAAVPHLEEMLFHYYYRGAYDDWWALPCNDAARYFERHADVPAVHSGGWFDPFASSTTDYYARMARQNRSPQRLIMGPWDHGTMREERSWSGDVDFGPDAYWGIARYNAERLRWFDRWLKDEPNGVEDDPPVRIFVMGGGDGRRTSEGKYRHGGRWRSETEWPLARARPTTLYLRSDGAVSAPPAGPVGSRLLSPEPPGLDDPPATFTYDPDHPVPTVGAPVTGFFELVPLPEGLEAAFASYVPLRARMRNIVMAGPMHQKEEPGIVAARPPYPLLAARPDVLVFQTPPLEEDVEVTGAPVVHLWISSSAVDTDFTAKLIDVCPPTEDYPEGFHLNLADSIIRCRYRDSFEREELMQPGEVYRVEIRLPPTSNLFKVGHRVRLDISSSSFPRFDLNPNTGEPMGRHTHTVIAENTIHLDRAHPSQVILPIIPS